MRVGTAAVFGGQNVGAISVQPFLEQSLVQKSVALGLHNASIALKQRYSLIAHACGVYEPSSASDGNIIEASDSGTTLTK